MGAALLIACHVGAARAQVPQERRPLQPMARVDLILARETAAQAGAGLSVAAGPSVRIDLTGAAGASWGERGESAGSGRVETVARFLLDPFRERARGWYAGGGVGARYGPGSRWRGVLVVIVGVEGGGGNSALPRRPVVPFAEIGYSGGVRLGVGLRRALRDGR